MCGIAGIYGDFEDADLKSMLECIEHRGPDDFGTFVDPDAPLKMGMRRLSIIDLDTGGQPIYNEDGSVVVTFNGEIYNYRTLRERLEDDGHEFATDSDTEVLVHLWEEHGERMPEYLNGMFAFAIWDRDRRSLFLARDRLGIKPLYYSGDEDGFVWASELEPILKTGISSTLDRQAVTDYFELRFSPWPRTLFDGIYELGPGRSMLVTESGVRQRQYWDLDGGEFQGSKQAAVREIRDRLERSVDRRMIADVSVGAFLSGGLDSSAVVGLMAERADDLKTFSVGFADATYDESNEAEFVASHFGTDHHALTVDLSSMDVFERVLGYYGEPLADPAILPTMLLAEHARDHVKVVLTGEGADELFGGYSYYRSLRRHRQIARRLPSPVFDLSKAVSSRTPIAQKHFRYLGGLASDQGAIRNVATKYCPDPETYLDGAGEGTLDQKIDATSDAGSPIDHQQTTFDVAYKLPGNLLYKVDRATMAASLEARVPFLDHELVEFAYALPSEYKFDGAYKPLLRAALRDVLPDRTMEREKHGFQLPFGVWLKQGYEAIDRWFEPNRVASTPYLDEAAVQRRLRAHRNGRESDELTLWKVLNYVCWYHTFAARYVE